VAINRCGARRSRAASVSLSAILREELTLGAGGRVEQTNYDAYRMLRCGEMPRVEVQIADNILADRDRRAGIPPIGPRWRTLCRRDWPLHYYAAGGTNEAT
jgi:hypothetical protein